jgi:hypothetical protein
MLRSVIRTEATMNRSLQRRGFTLWVATLVLAVLAAAFAPHAHAADACCTVTQSR